MSPVWLVLAAPALLLPFGVVFLFEDEAMPSLVEQAVSSLPIPGDASGSGETAHALRIAPLGDPGTRLPASVSAALYNNSARADAARLSRRVDLRDTVPNLAVTGFALLHPRSRAGEDLLIADFALMFATPATDFTWAILNAYCNPAPNEGFQSVAIERLPINPLVVSAMVNFVPANEYAALCPRLGDP